MQISASMVKALRERTGAGMMECKKALTEAGGDLEAAVEQMRKSGLAKADKKAGRVAAEGVIASALSADGHLGALVEVNCETDFVGKGDDFRGFGEALAQRAVAEQPADAEALLALAFEAGSAKTVDDIRREMVARIGENISVRRLAYVQHDSATIASYLHGARIGVLAAVSGSDADAGRDVAMHVAATSPLALDEAALDPAVITKEKEILLAQVADSGKPPEIMEKMVSGRMKKYLGEVTLKGQPFVKDPDQTVEKYLASKGAEVLAYARLEVGEGIEKKTDNFVDEVMAQVKGSE